jgi:hypothetical protein
MEDAPGVQRALNKWYIANRDALIKGDDSALEERTYGGHFGFWEFVSATVGYSPTQHFIWSFSITIQPIVSNDATRLLITIDNESSMTSFFHYTGYDLGSWERSDFRPFGTTSQIIQWYTPLER